ncbi:hypothetical protein AtubIFM55763_008070 [Aspergillus tubingensis]|nr:hypothetical protein AtubIFM55763_008070 [Aspergillus tubingensis]
MEQTLVLWLEEFLQGDVHGAFTHAAQSGRRAIAPSERDKKEERREPLPFRGSYIPDEFHRWGYVMWDAARLERTGAKEVLARGWDLMWGEDEDARDQRDFF